MKNKRIRLEKNERYECLLKNAVQLSKDIGYMNITREKVALRAKVSEGLINRYFSKINNLKKNVILYSIDHEVIEIIAQGLALKNKTIIKKISSETMKKALKYLENKSG